MKKKEIPVAGSNYPCGPCHLPVKCANCGTIITKDNVVDKDDCGCEVCVYCDSGSCPTCGEHWHCGGCI